MPSAVRSVIAVIMLVVLWQLVVFAGFVPERYFPGPLTVAQAFAKSVARGEVTSAVALTFGRAILGLIASVIFGIALAVLATQFKLFGRAMAPIADLFRSLPPAAITPVSIFFLGLGWQLYAFILVFACFWPVYMNAYAALNAVPRQQLASASVFGYRGWSRMFRVQLPAAMPDTFIGIRLAAAIALIASIVAEMLAGRNGLGFMMSDAAFTLRIPDTFVGLVAAMALGVVMNQLVLLARRWSIGWHQQMTTLHKG